MSDNPVGALPEDQGDVALAMYSVGEGLQAIGSTVGVLLENLERALSGQEVAESARQLEASRSRQRFWITIAGIVLANIIVISISVTVLIGQATARDMADARSAANRDRQQCATSLLVEWDARLGDALRVTTQLPQVDPASPEYRNAVARLNSATLLLNQASPLCYGDHPNPDPIPR